MLRSMNPTQSKVFYDVRKWCLEQQRQSDDPPFRLLVHGGTGVDKSHLIRCIEYEATKLLQNPENPDDITVLLTSFTGTAAHNIGGMTLHSALRFPTKLKNTYEALNDEKLNSLRAQFHSLKILIIDVISMASPRMLCYVHGRLQQIQNSRRPDDFFRNVSILAVGDIYQLKPVKSNLMCVEDKKESLAWELWSQFEYVELTQVMRQKDDLIFANPLNELISD